MIQRNQRVFEIHRNGKEQIRERIQEAVKDYYARHRTLPTVVVVNPQEAEAAQAALERLDLRVPLETSPGCLIPEVWLGVEGEEG